MWGGGGVDVALMPAVEKEGGAGSKQLNKVTSVADPASLEFGVGGGRFKAAAVVLGIVIVVNLEETGGSLSAVTILCGLVSFCFLFLLALTTAAVTGRTSLDVFTLSCCINRTWDPCSTLAASSEFDTGGAVWFLTVVSMSITLFLLVFFSYFRLLAHFFSIYNFSFNL